MTGRIKKEENINGTAMVAIPEMMSISVSGQPSNRWILGSERIRHMMNRCENFITVTMKNVTVQISNDDLVASLGYEMVNLTSIIRESKNTIMLQNVLYTRDLIYNLISLSPPRRNEFRVIIDNCKNDPHSCILNLIHRKSELIKMVRVVLGLHAIA